MDRLSAAKHQSRLPDPRIRGDGPLWQEDHAAQVDRPPHTRGWTRRRSIAVLLVGQTPAYAGMDLIERERTFWNDTDPRIRGDGPGPLCVKPISDTRPPHTRGWTPSKRFAGPAAYQTPAYAGMDPSFGSMYAWSLTDPRIRGDGPDVQGTLGEYDRRPPHTRGWTSRTRRESRHEHQTPAYAGMDLIVCCEVWSAVTDPRIRGDGPNRRCPLFFISTRPPHTRGWTSVSAAVGSGGRQTPAYAGMDLRRLVRKAHETPDPRIRGDGPNYCVQEKWCVNRPPHTRGWTLMPSSYSRNPRQTPAYAGMDPASPSSMARRTADPRIRGDGPLLAPKLHIFSHRPPHTRGWTPRRGGRKHAFRQTPAYAGMDLVLMALIFHANSDPRIRGDGPG